jgi:YidC/Oxa1 family membrane protein insertase
VIATSIWSQLLNGLGAALAYLYSWVHNYGIAIILLTIGIRVVLLPLGIKQIRSMQAMQAIQPKVKQLQTKYKGDRQKLNEEMMKLYKDHGVNPLSGCLPLLLQFPVLIALYAVLRVPGGAAHVPADSALRSAIHGQHTQFLGTSLLCSAAQAGKQVKIVLKKGETSYIGGKTLNCGHGGASRLPYYGFALLMVGTTYYQQRQMQKATPQGSQQQQALTRIMPILFGVWGYLFPAGLVIYWSTTNVIQIGQQHFMLPRIQEEAANRAGKGEARGGTTGRPAGRGTGGAAKPKLPAAGGTDRPRGDGQADRTDGSKPGSPGRAPGSRRPSGAARPGGNRSSGGGTSGGTSGAGGSNAGSRKKRRKR